MRLPSWNRLEKERLETALATLEETLPNPPTKPWQTSARNLAKEARAYAENKRWDAGWTVLMAARREALARLTAKSDRTREAERILKEGQDKLHGWRKDAVEAQLKQHHEPGARQDVPVETLRAAQEILDEHFGNLHRRRYLLRRQLLLLSLFLLLSLAITMIVAIWDLAGDTAPEVLKDEALLGAVMGLGVLGASVSAATAIVHADARMRVPDVRWALTLMTVRPLVGAASAALVVILLQSGFGRSVRLEDAAVYAVALVAGFSERLAASGIERAARAIEK